MISKKERISGAHRSSLIGFYLVQTITNVSTQQVFFRAMRALDQRDCSCVSSNLRNAQDLKSAIETGFHEVVLC